MKFKITYIDKKTKALSIDFKEFKNQEQAKNYISLVSDKTYEIIEVIK